MADRDTYFMRLAIAQAHQSIPVDSAYCVGCVIILNDTVVSSGFSRELPGNTHAVSPISLILICTIMNVHECAGDIGAMCINEAQHGSTGF
jgi:hypothetical protein